MLKSSRRVPAFGLPLLVSGACLVLPPAHAQVLEEVLVTAQKREQSLQDVPVAVSAITGEMLEQSGVKDMFDLSNNTPSLIVSATQSSSTTTFAIRGVFTSSQNFGLESSVGLYVDGVYRFTGAELAARAAAAGLVPKGDLVWYQAGTRLRPYGYPRAFVPNIAHQHIVVLRREASRAPRRPRRGTPVAPAGAGGSAR